MNHNDGDDYMHANEDGQEYNEEQSAMHRRDGGSSMDVEQQGKYHIQRRLSACIYAFIYTLLCLHCSFLAYEYSFSRVQYKRLCHPQ